MKNQEIYKTYEGEPNNEEMNLFWRYVLNIWQRCQLPDHRQNVWEDFPCDFWMDRESWQDKSSMDDVKLYIDQVRYKYPGVKRSAMLFWQHWLKYRNINRRLGKIS